MALFRADPHNIVVGPKGDGDFGEILEEVFGFDHDFERRGQPNNRWGANEDNWIIIDRLQKGRKSIAGTAFHLRMDDLPVRGGRGGIRDLDLLEDEGIGKHVAFLWDPEKQQFWVQRDRSALSVGGVIGYLQDRVEERIMCKPVFGHDAVKRAMKLKRIKTITLDFTDSFDATAEKSAWFGDFVRIRKKYGAAHMEIRLVPARGDALDPAAQSLLSETATHIDSGGTGVRKARVEGWRTNDEDEELGFIDLLRDRADHLMEVRNDRVRNPEAMIANVRKVWLNSRK